MESFLEYVCTRLMGAPDFGSSWCCPFCDSDSAAFHVRPAKGNHPIKFKCFKCEQWGDSVDLLTMFFPKDNIRQRKRRLHLLHKDYEAGVMPSDQSTALFSFRGPAGHRKHKAEVICPKCTTEMHEDELDYLVSDGEFSDETVAMAKSLYEMLEDVSAEEYRKLMKFAQKALEVSAEGGIHPLVLAGQVGFLEWSEGINREHIEQVGHGLADCDHDICMAKKCKSFREAKEAGTLIRPNHKKPFKRAKKRRAVS